PTRGGAGGCGVAAGRLRQDRPGGRLGPTPSAAGGVAVAGRGRQRPDTGLAPRRRRAGPGAPRDRRAGRRAPAGSAARLVGGGGDLPGQRAGRRGRGGRSGAGRLSPDPGAAGPPVPRLSAGAPPALPASGGGPPRRPPLPVAGLRARGQLAEVREGDLRFTPEETAALLRAAVGPDLLEAAVAVLGERTEGGAAGLRRGALSLHGHAGPAGFVATFSGSQRYVLDYLAEEVLDRQPEPLRAFLLETSVLERLAGELCDAVTGRTDGQQLLEQIERANLFLVPLDEVRGWWRYHHLFADLLRAPLGQTRPERVAGLHRAAVAWCEQHGLVDDAVRHGLAAGDSWWAARLLERHLDRLLLQGEGATLQRWLGRLPAALAGSRPRAVVGQGRP